MKLGSLFDGSGGFPLAGSLCGIEPVWAAEVEPYPIAVTRSRFNGKADTPLLAVLKSNFPGMKLLMEHLGDISKINGAEIEPVDIVTFGSPCQGLSQAGLRKGLEDDRSGLFMEAVRIIREMKEATHGRFPAYALWENVPGAFSSNGGEDFRIVLEELIKIVEPTAVMPAVPKNGWPYADSYCGDGWSLAYRVFDAQYWGVPQRRRRIHLVLDLRGERAREVLFEREGVRGYFAEGRTPWQGFTAHAEGSPGADDRAGAVPYTLKIRSGCEGGGKGALVQTDKSATLATNNDQYLFQPVTLEPGIAAREGGHIYEGVSGTLRAEAGDNRMAVAYSIENHPADSRVNIDDSGKVQTLTSRMGTGGGNVPMVMEPKPIDRPAVAYEDKEAYALTTGNFMQVTKEVSPTLMARDWKDPTCVAVRYIVRRLTPTECARLQGFADRWGDIDNKTEFSDAEYRFWLEVRNTHATVIGGREAKEYTKEQMLKWYNGLQTDSSEYKM